MQYLILVTTTHARCVTLLRILLKKIYFAISCTGTVYCLWTGINEWAGMFFSRKICFASFFSRKICFAMLRISLLSFFSQKICFAMLRISLLSFFRLRFVKFAAHFFSRTIIFAENNIRLKFYITLELFFSWKLTVDSLGTLLLGFFFWHCQSLPNSTISFDTVPSLPNSFNDFFANILYKTAQICGVVWCGGL